MNVLITGSNGFIAKNLLAELRNRKYKNIYLFHRDVSLEQLNTYLDKCDCIVHLAGVNRPKYKTEFDSVNIGLTEYIVDYLEEHKRKPKIIFSSSIQAELENEYGLSKKRAEDILVKFAEENRSDVVIYRLTNVFGKWCLPNYNSVVATFCNNIANEKEICIHNVDAKISLVYIDDVVENIIHVMEKNEGLVRYMEIEPVYEVTVGKIAELINGFKRNREDLKIPNFSNDFEKKLYSTYLSYLDKNHFSYPLMMNVDERGSFTEFIRLESKGQISINITKPGITKGNHWHHTKVEKFLVVKGTALIQLRYIYSDEVIEYTVSDKKLEVVDIPVGYTHNIKNIGNDDLVTVMWVNEEFNKDKPDTYFEVV